MRITKKISQLFDLIIVFQIANVTLKKSKVYDTWYSNMK